MNLDAEKIRTFVVNEIVGKMLSRVLPGIMLFVIINQTLMLKLSVGSFITGLLFLFIWWVLGYCMEFYNRRIPIIRKLYNFKAGFDAEKASLSILFTNLATGMLWAAILYYARGIYREGVMGIYFEFGVEKDPYELHVMAILFILIFLGMVLLWRRDAKE